MSDAVFASWGPPVGVVGLGTLGQGIAACLLGHGLRVVAYERSAAARGAARDAIGAAIDELVARGGLAPQIRDAWPGRYLAADGWADFAPCGLVVDSAAEEPAEQRAVLERLEAVVGPATPLGSSAAGLPLAALQEGRLCPARVLGMHWAEPAHATRFLELVAGPATSAETLDIARRLGRQIGKDPLVVPHDLPGFVANRLAYAVYREALALLAAGVADAETIDRGFRNSLGAWSALCGPLRWIDLTGGPAFHAEAMAPVLPTLCGDGTLPEPLRRLAAEGARGIANGRGFYAYTPEEAAAWRARLREHAWIARELLDRDAPLPASETSEVFDATRD
jgi:3-hydroxybutyryl-CoA dehydrogenase